MSRLFEFDPDARADLREITRYSRKRWGKARGRAYTDALKRCIENLAKGIGFYKDLSEISPHLRMVLCQHHYVFVLPRENAPAVVLAILHERMDIIARLKARL
jgi:plasmid stabilization system protein ParE